MRCATASGSRDQVRRGGDRSSRAGRPRARSPLRSVIAPRRAGTRDRVRLLGRRARCAACRPGRRRATAPWWRREPSPSRERGRRRARRGARSGASGCGGRAGAVASWSSAGGLGRDRFRGRAAVADGRRRRSDRVVRRHGRSTGGGGHGLRRWHGHVGRRRWSCRVAVGGSPPAASAWRAASVGGRHARRPRGGRRCRRARARNSTSPASGETRPLRDRGGLDAMRRWSSSATVLAAAARCACSSSVDCATAGADPGVHARAARPA